MATLEFKGPFHFSHINSLNLNGKIGVYIWGVVIDLNKKKIINYSKQDVETPLVINNELTGCIFNNSKFIPYYVGKVQSKPIKRRLIEHNAVDSDTNSLKYKRLFLDYYCNFFNDLNFPINDKNPSTKQHTKDILTFVKNNPGKIEYYNDGDVLKELFYPKKGVVKGTDFPIKAQKFNDSLSEIVVDNNNFWFCYAEPKNYTNEDENQINIDIKIFMEILEAQTFYSLKGKTISHSQDFLTNIINFNHSINPSSTCQNIFDFNTLFPVTPTNPNPSMNFPGY